jgi:hypothetical protein
MQRRTGRTAARTNFFLIFEFPVTICVPRGIPPPETDAICQALDDPTFQADLDRGVRAVIQQRPTLGKVRVTITW